MFIFIDRVNLNKMEDMVHTRKGVDSIKNFFIMICWKCGSVDILFGVHAFSGKLICLRSLNRLITIGRTIE